MTAKCGDRDLLDGVYNTFTYNTTKCVKQKKKLYLTGFLVFDCIPFFLKTSCGWLTNKAASVWRSFFGSSSDSFVSVAFNFASKLVSISWSFLFSMNKIFLYDSSQSYYSRPKVYILPSRVMWMTKVKNFCASCEKWQLSERRDVSGLVMVQLPVCTDALWIVVRGHVS